jgi:hypothetical protein
MDNTRSYNGSLTAEQFLFYEIRIAARLYLDGKAIEEAIEEIKKDNLFQYPTEREVSRLARACYKRLNALDNEELIRELASAPVSVAKQINLYAIMKYNRLVWEFMIQVIGEKYRNQDFAFSRKDINSFLTRLQAQDDSVATWSEGTINKIKSVLVRMLVETEYLDNIKDVDLNPVFLCEELEQGIRANNDLEALCAFNCFR